VLLPSEKHAVAVHEAGHALVAALSAHADPVAKVTILPAGQTLGVTEQLPLVERHLGAGGDQLSSRPFAEATQATLDAEVARLVGEAEQRAVKLIESHQGQLRQLADLLVEQETIDGSAVYRLLGVQPPSERPVGTTVAPRRSAPARQPAAHDAQNSSVSS
jgi:ATP-dependent Zn protease